MDLSNIIRIRELSKTNKYEMRLILDNMFEMHSSRDMLLWDDDNEVVHAIRSNNDNNDLQHPVKIMTTTYEHVQHIELHVNMDGLNTFLDTCSFQDNLDEIKTHLNEWFKTNSTGGDIHNINNKMVSAAYNRAEDGSTWSKDPKARPSVDGKKFE